MRTNYNQYETKTMKT